KDVAGESLGLPQGQVKDEPQRQNQLDRQIRVASLTAGRRPSGRLPPSNRRFVDPQRQVAASLEAGFVLRPVLDTVAGPWNAVTAGGVEFERHLARVAG